MEIVRHRILTMKSVLGIGRYDNIPIERLLLIEPNAVRYAYYRYEAIDFNDEVKKAADIRIEIPKPGCDWDKYVENARLIRSDLTEEERMHSAMHMKRRRRVENDALRAGNAMGRYMSKGYMQAVNHGRAKVKP